MTYVKAEMEVMHFDVEDVITTSNAISNPYGPDVEQVPPNPPVVDLPVAEIPEDVDDYEERQ